LVRSWRSDSKEDIGHRLGSPAKRQHMCRLSQGSTARPQKPLVEGTPHVPAHLLHPHLQPCIWSSVLFRHWDVLMLTTLTYRSSLHTCTGDRYIEQRQAAAGTTSGPLDSGPAPAGGAGAHSPKAAAGDAGAGGTPHAPAPAIPPGNSLRVPLRGFRR
jgi:hypothetical protein